jgi:hypothetical protein
MALREQLEDLLQWIPDGVLSQRLPADHLSIFYHTVSDESLPHVRRLFGYKSVAAFERDLSEYFDVARPSLLRYGIPCAFFVVENFLDNKALMHRCKVSLCQDELESSASQRVAHVWTEFENRFPDAGLDRSATSRFFAGLDYARLDQIDALCEICEIEAYLKERQPYLTTQQARRLQAGRTHRESRGANQRSLRYLWRRDLRIVSGGLQTHGRKGSALRDHLQWARTPTGGTGIAPCRPSVHLDLLRHERSARGS